MIRPWGSQTTVVTIRMDPRLRVQAEIAAAKHRRSLSGFIRWAIRHRLEMDKEAKA